MTKSEQDTREHKMTMGYRVEWMNWGVGIAIDFNQPWLTFRLGPLIIDYRRRAEDW